MNRKSRKSREMMDLMELNNEITRFLKDDQYFVTLNILSRRRALRTERPNEDSGLNADHTTSNMDPEITTVSKRLKEDSK